VPITDPARVSTDGIGSRVDFVSTNYQLSVISGTTLGPWYYYSSRFFGMICGTLQPSAKQAELLQVEGQKGLPGINAGRDGDFLSEGGQARTVSLVNA
jgi:hypothetical protein